MFDLNRGLSPLENSPKFRYGAWDIEASDWWNLEMIGVYDGSHYYHFRDVGSFLNHIVLDRYRGFRWFAHFGGRYDFNFIFDFLRAHRSDIAVSFYCSGSLVIQMTLRIHNVTVKLCDSYRLFYMPADTNSVRTTNKSGLRDLGKAFQVTHQKGEMDFDSENSHYSKALIDYNELDCRCLYEVIERFYAETGIYSETFATHTLKVWRKDFLKRTIWKPRPEVTEFCRQSYHGGRVEVFKRHSNALTAYDVNSMYPFVMLSEMPVDFIGESHRLLDHDFGFVEAQVEIPDCYTPSLPVRLEKLYFPRGTLTGIWTAEELREAEHRGTKILKILKAYYFKTEAIFKEYVLKLYELKRRSGEPTRTIAKGLLNALHGKFGQNPVKKLYMTEDIAPDGAFPILTPEGLPSGFASVERISQQSYLLPHLASAVTSKARLHLLTALNESSYYCDTDSVFTDQIMVTSDQLGAWSEVGSGEANFIQPKLYKFKGQWKSKGLNRSESIDAFISGSPNVGQRTRSIKEALRMNLPACSHVQVQKMLRETRPKRAWDGDDTRPWNIGELL